MPLISMGRAKRKWPRTSDSELEMYQSQLCVDLTLNLIGFTAIYFGCACDTELIYERGVFHMIL